MNTRDIINSTVDGRFIIRFESKEINTLKSLPDQKLQNTDVIQLQRKSTTPKGWRTLSICTVTSSEDINFALQWSAECKEELLDPESADLYLLMLTQDFEISKEECLSIEANEKFCRKLILRPEESLEQLLARTFLVSISEPSESSHIMDPLTLALKETNKNFSWFDDSQQGIWRKALLSSKTGQELIDRLFQEPEKES